MSIGDPQAFLASMLQRQGLPGVAVDGSSTNSAKVPNPTDLAKTQIANPDAPANQKTIPAEKEIPLATEHSYAKLSLNNEDTKDSNGSTSDSSLSSEEADSDAEEDKHETRAAKLDEDSSRKIPTRGRGRPRKYVDDFASVNTQQTTPTQKPTKPGTPAKKEAAALKAQTPTAAASNSRQITLSTRAVMSEGSRKRGKGCGNCPGCLREDCGSCIYCKDKPKFGGPGKKKQRCALRICSNFVRVNAPGVRRQSKSQLATLAATTTAPASPSLTQTKLTTSIASKEMAASKVVTKTTTPVTSISVTSTGSKTAIVTITTLPSTLPTTTTTAPSSDDKKDEEVEEEVEEDKMQCVQCGRERLKSMARSDTFCTQRCAQTWVDSQPEGTTRAAAIPIKVRQSSRELKNLHIDMALPGTTLPHTEGGENGAASSTEPMDTAPPPPPPPPKKPALRSNTASPKPASPVVSVSSAVTAKPTAGIMKKTTAQPSSTKKAPAVIVKKVETVVSGIKRPAAVTSQSPLPPVKKVKIDATLPSAMAAASMGRGVTFDLLPMTTLKPISAPPLNRCVPPPSISIVPLDQLSALGDALSQHNKDATNKSRFPPGLPKDIRAWTIAQVVQYFSSTSDCHDYADLFKEQEVDGTALLLLSHESLVKCLNIKLGRALKIMLHVEELRKMFEKQ